MADIQHSIITDPDVHEPKGISTAPANTTYVANGAGSGDWTVVDYKVQGQEVLSGRSYVSQSPSTTDTSLQLTFGPAVSATDAALDAAGNLTILTAGTYQIVFVLRLARTSATGEALLGARWKVNGSTVGGPTAIRLANGGFSVPFSFTTTRSFSVNDVITAEIIRDSTGVNNGGVFPADFVAADWQDAASAVVIVNKLNAAL